MVKSIIRYCYKNSTKCFQIIGECCPTQRQSIVHVSFFQTTSCSHKSSQPRPPSHPIEKTVKLLKYPKFKEAKSVTLWWKKCLQPSCGRTIPLCVMNGGQKHMETLHSLHLELQMVQFFSDIPQIVIYEEKPGKFNCFLCGSYEIFRTESQFQCLSLVSDEEEL